MMSFADQIQNPLKNYEWKIQDTYEQNTNLLK